MTKDTKASVEAIVTIETKVANDIETIDGELGLVPAQSEHCVFFGDHEIDPTLAGVADHHKQIYRVRAVIVSCFSRDP